MNTQVVRDALNEYVWSEPVGATTEGIPVGAWRAVVAGVTYSGFTSRTEALAFVAAKYADLTYQRDEDGRADGEAGIVSEARPERRDYFEAGELYCGECGCTVGHWRSKGCSRCALRHPLDDRACTCTMRGEEPGWLHEGGCPLRKAEAAERDNAQLAERLTRAEGALREYGMHLTSCHYHWDPLLGKPKPGCTCGYQQALDGDAQ